MALQKSEIRPFRGAGERRTLPRKGSKQLFWTRVKNIIGELCEAALLQRKRLVMEEILCQLGVRDATYRKWRKGYGGFPFDQAKRLIELEQGDKSSGHMSQPTGVITPRASACMIVPSDKS